jgi:hypothetical protein
MSDSPGLGKGTNSFQLVDHNGNPFGVRHTRNAIDVFIQDQTTLIQDLYMHRNLGTFFLQDNAAADSTLLNVTSHNVTSGDLICLKEDARHYQGVALTVTNSQIGMDTPTDYTFTTSADMHHAEHDLAVNGSPSSEYCYHIEPPPGAVWDIVRIMIHMEDSRDMDDAKFAGGDALLNGIVLRRLDGGYKNIFNAKSNGDLAERAYDRDYNTGALGPAGENSVIVRRTFGGQSKNGVVIRLNGTSGDQLQALIRDNVSSLSHFHIVAQGHVVE